MLGNAYNAAKSANDLNTLSKQTGFTVEELQKVQADLEAERQRLYDPKYIEKLAREDHNMVGKNEVPLFIKKGKTIPLCQPAMRTSQLRLDELEWIG